MVIVLGLIILVAAVVVGVVGVMTNRGQGHELTHSFSVFGYHLTGSTGRLFLFGIVVGAVAVFGLSLLLTAARRTSRRGRVARGQLNESRRQTAAVRHDRDDLRDERDNTGVDTPAVPEGRAPAPMVVNHGPDRSGPRDQDSASGPHEQEAGSGLAP